MRKLLALMASLLAACGSSSSSGPSYAVKDSAVSFDATSGCVLTATTTVGVSLAIVDVTDYTAPTACASLQGNTVPANGAAAGIIIARADFTTAGGPAPGLVAETYPFFDLATLAPPASKIPPFDSGGKAAFFTGALVKCGATGGPAEAQIVGGSVTVTSVSGTQIAGSVNAALAGGGSLTGSFTASLCTVPAIDVCAAVQALSLSLPTPTCS
jgi:hypothetical protein